MRVFLKDASSETLGDIASTMNLSKLQIVDPEFSPLGKK